MKIDIVIFFLITAFYLLGNFVINNFASPYSKKKAENLATKEDMKQMNRISEEMKLEFQKINTEFSKDVDFKYQFYYKQFSELYVKLYSYIIYSEYLRLDYSKIHGVPLLFDDVPYVRIEAAINENSDQENKTNDLITEILNKAELASPRLLKLAVLYKTIYAMDNFDEQSKSVLKKIIETILYDYNFYRKELKLEYSENEMVQLKLEDNA